MMHPSIVTAGTVLVLLHACMRAHPAGEEAASGEGLVYVVRSEADTLTAPAPEAIESVVLSSEEHPAWYVRFDVFSSERAAKQAGQELYRRVAHIRGPSHASPASAVYAEWELADVSQGPAFEENRKGLFRVRAEAIAGFHADWLLQRVDQPGRYLILGLYADAAARDQARVHPRVRSFAEAHPLSVFAARDVYGVRNFQVRP